MQKSQHLIYSQVSRGLKELNTDTHTHSLANTQPDEDDKPLYSSDSCYCGGLILTVDLFMHFILQYKWFLLWSDPICVSDISSPSWGWKHQNDVSVSSLTFSHLLLSVWADDPSSEAWHILTFKQPELKWMLFHYSAVKWNMCESETLRQVSLFWTSSLLILLCCAGSLFLLAPFRPVT